MASGSWANAGAGFNLGHATNSSARSTPQQAPPSRSATAPRKSHSTQRLLRPLDKTPLVTPRPSSSASRPAQKQSRLSLAPTASASSTQRRPPALKDNRRDSLAADPKGKGRALVVPDSEEAEEAPLPPPKRARWFRGLFGRASKPGPSTSTSSSSSSPSSTSSRGPRSTGIGRAIVRPTERRRGPTIDFDDDLPHDDHDDHDELAGEAARRKRRRTEDRGGFGRLDLCDEDVHAGFGTPPSEEGERERERQKRSKRELELVGAAERDDDLEPRAASGRTRSRAGQGLDVRPDSQPEEDELLPLPQARPVLLASSSRAIPPHTITLRSTPASASASDDELEAEPSTASSGSSAERSLQERLVQTVPARRAPRVLVPDSDPPSPGGDEWEARTEGEEQEEEEEEDELDALVQRLGAKGAGGTALGAGGGGVDDSGFAEAEIMELDDGHERDGTPSPRHDDDGGVGVMDLTVVPSSSPLPAPALLGAPRPREGDSRSSPASGGSGGSLARTASGILMPPPAVPSRRLRLRRGAPSTRAAAGAEAEAQARVLVEDTQVRSPSRRAAVPAREQEQPYFVACDETQTQAQAPEAESESGAHQRSPVPHYRALPRLPRPANLPRAGELSSPASAPHDRLSSDPDALPPLPTPRPLAVPLGSSPTPAPAPAPATWDAVAAAWEGARLPSPPPPAAPRQTRLGEFFAAAAVGGGGGVVPASQDGDVVVEDSQFAGAAVGEAESALEEALRRQKALNEARERRTGMRLGPLVEAEAEHGDDDDDVLDAATSSPLTPLPATPPASTPTPPPPPPPPRQQQQADPERAEEEPDQVPDSDPEDDAPSLAPLSPSSALAAAAAAASASLRRPDGSSVAGPASPLGTPVRKRFPRYSPGKMRRVVAAAAAEAQAQAATGAARELETETEEEGGGGEREETQWESYWSYPSGSSPVGGAASRGAVDMDADDDDEEDEALALPAGWGRGAKGELVRISTPAPASTVRAAEAIDVQGIDEDTLTGW